MSHLTLFSAPKPFTDAHIATIQRNAIESWMRLPGVEVLLFGQETGLEQAAGELGATHIPGVRHNPNGIPLVSSMLQLARENCTGELLCIINTDMILMSDFVETVNQMRGQKARFVLLSQRWDAEITERLDFSPGWEDRLRSTVLAQGRLHRPAGSDFFLFPRDCYTEVPDFAIGRAGWDNWMIYKARQAKWPVIDCTPSVMIVHQNHDYSHLPGGKPHHEHPDSNENIRLAGGQAAIRYTILDATHRLVNGRIVRPVYSGPRFWRAVEIILRKVFFFLPGDTLENIVRPKRWSKRFRRLLGNR